MNAQPFEPRFEGTTLAMWAMRVSHALEYRTYPDQDAEDLYQEAGRIAHVAATTRRFDNQVHFAAYVRRCFVNHVTDLAAARNRKGHGLTPSFSYVDGPDHEVDGPGASDPVAEFARHLDEAPESVSRLVAMFACEDGGRREDAPRPARHRTPERQNEYLCSLLGLDPGTNDLIGLLSRWLEGGRQVA